MKEKIVYYDNFEQDFTKISKKTIKIDEKFEYLSKNIFYKFFSFIWYRLVFFPIGFIYCKIIRKVKCENKKALSTYKNKPIYLYCNHTNALCDAFYPSLLFPHKKPYLIVDKKNLQLPILKRSTKMLGALPLPDTIKSTKNFLKTLEEISKKNHPTIIYPEGHLWQFHTSIRPFKSGAFKYPIKLNCEIFVATTTYQKTKKSFKTVVYIDGPIKYDKNIDIKINQANIEQQVFDIMNKRSKNSNFEKIKYINTKEKKND